MDSNLKKQIYNKESFNKTINNEFTQLVTKPDPTFFDINLATIDDFFILYNKLFYEIPKLGDTNSHEYLYKTSKQYVGFEDIDEQIQALISEIDSLRELNLALQEENIQLSINNSNSNDIISKPIKVQKTKLKK